MRRSLVHRSSTLSPLDPDGLLRGVHPSLGDGELEHLVAGSAATPACGRCASARGILLHEKAGQLPASSYNRSRGSVLGHFHPAAAELAARTVRASRGTLHRVGGGKDRAARYATERALPIRLAHRFMSDENELGRRPRVGGGPTVPLPAARYGEILVSTRWRGRCAESRSPAAADPPARFARSPPRWGLRS